MTFACDPAATAARIVTLRGRSDARPTARTAPPHVGRGYDLREDGRPLRVLLIVPTSGRQAGGGPAERMAASMAKPLAARDAEVQGITHALRLAVGRLAGADRVGELLPLEDGAPLHVYDACAVLGYDPADATTGDHTAAAAVAPAAVELVEAVEVLAPTLCLVLGDEAAAAVIAAGEVREGITPNVVRVRLGRHETVVAGFAAPTARLPQRWGSDAILPYLKNTVAPAIRAARGAAGLPLPTHAPVGPAAVGGRCDADPAAEGGRRAADATAGSRHLAVEATAGSSHSAADATAGSGRPGAEPATASGHPAADPAAALGHVCAEPARASLGGVPARPGTGSMRGHSGSAHMSTANGRSPGRAVITLPGRRGENLPARPEARPARTSAGASTQQTAAEGRARVLRRVRELGGEAHVVQLGRRSELRVDAGDGVLREVRVVTRRRGDWQVPLADTATAASTPGDTVPSTSGDTAASTSGDTTMPNGSGAFVPDVSGDTAASGQGSGDRVWVLVDLVSTVPRFHVVPNAWMVADMAGTRAERAQQSRTGERIRDTATHHRVTPARVAQWQDRWDLLGLQALVS